MNKLFIPPVDFDFSTKVSFFYFKFKKLSQFKVKKGLSFKKYNVFFKNPLKKGYSLI